MDMMLGYRLIFRVFDRLTVATLFFRANKFFTLTLGSFYGEYGPTTIGTWLANWLIPYRVITVRVT